MNESVSLEASERQSNEHWGIREKEKEEALSKCVPFEISRNDYNTRKSCAREIEGKR